MNYCNLFSRYHIAVLYDWLETLGNLFVRLEFPHSGGAGLSYQVGSLEELKLLISKQTHPEIEILIFNSQMLTDDELDECLELPWIYRNGGKVIYIAVKKNRNYYEAYQKEPMKYEKVISDWFAEI